MDKQRMNTTYGVTGKQSSLEVNLMRMDEKTLSLRYRFRNGDIRNAFLFNRLYHGVNEQSVYIVDANLVNIEMERDGIVISKKIVSVPMEIDVEKTVTPCVTRVRPQEELEETFTIELPLKRKTPYLNLHDSVTKYALSDRRILVWFELGFFFAPSETERLVKTVSTLSGSALYFDPFPISSQQIMRVGPFQIQLPVHESHP